MKKSPQGLESGQQELPALFWAKGFGKRLLHLPFPLLRSRHCFVALPAQALGLTCL